MQKYHDIFELIQNDPNAKAYYEKLPDYMREQIGTRAEKVNSFASLRDYAENLARE